MHPLVKLLVAWMAATAVSVGLAVAAVSVVTESVTEQRPQQLSAEGVRQALTEDAAGSPTSTATTPAGGSTPGPATSATAPGTSGSRPPATAPPATVPPATPATTGPSPAAPAEDRTYQLVGGTVGVRFENGRARLLWATPNPGFRVEAGGSGDDEVDIRFRGEEHESRLRAFWDNGPQADVEEKD